MKYQVTITETLSRKISIEAPTAEIAEEQVRGLYRDEEIVLGNSDFCYFANYHHKEEQQKLTQQLLDKICPHNQK